MKITDPKDLVVIERALDAFRNFEQSYANGTRVGERPPELRSQADADYQRAAAILRRVRAALRS